MKNFAEYSSHDFATEPLFIKWVQQPNNDEIGNFWNNWLSNHPYKSVEIDEAKLIVKKVSCQFNELSKHEVDSLWNKIRKSIYQLPKENYEIPNSKPFSFIFWLMLIAVISTLAWYFKR